MKVKVVIFYDESRFNFVCADTDQVLISLLANLSNFYFPLTMIDLDITLVSLGSAIMCDINITSDAVPILDDINDIAIQFPRKYISSCPH